MKANQKLITQILIDSVLGVTFLLAFQPKFTGLPIHEWMGLSIAGVVLVHLLMSWNWVVNISKKFLQKLPGQTRLLYVLNWALLVAFLGVSVTGILISKIVFHHEGENHSLVGIHKLFANGILVLMALHLALNWQWVVNLWNKYAVQPWARRTLKPQVSSIPAVAYVRSQQRSKEVR